MYAHRALWNVFALLAGGISFGTVASAQDRPESSARPIVAGCEIDYPPYCIVGSDQQADGFSVELLRAVLGAMGREVVYRTGVWSDLKQDLAEGRLEVLPLVGRTPEREALYDFSQPYLTMHGTIIVRQDSTSIRRREDLKGKRVAVLQGDNAEEYLRRSDLGAVIVPRPSAELALRELSSGQHDAVVIQKLVGLQLIAAAGLTDLTTAGPPLKDFTQTFCLAVRKGNAELLALLNEGLSIAMADGTFRALRAKWFAPIEAIQRSRSRVIVGGDNNYPPYEFLDQNGIPAGYNVDLTRAIARELGIPVEIRLGPWDTIRKGLAAGEIDLVQGMFYSVERDKEFGFSPAHTVVQHVIVTRRGAPEPTSLTELGGMKILVMAGDIMEDLAIKQGLGSQLARVASQEDALRELAGGRGDCALVAKVPAHYWIKANEWQNLVVGSTPIVGPEYCYAAPKENQEVLATFAEGLATLKETGEYRKIQTKWLSPYEAAGPSSREVIKAILVVTVPLLALLTLVFAWSYSLKRQVHNRTRELTQEIAERKQAERDLQRTKERLQLATHAGNIGIWDWDVERNELIWDDTMYRLYGVRREDFAGAYQAWMSRLHPDDVAGTDAAIQAALRDQKEYAHQFRIIWPDGSIREIQAESNTIRDDNGMPLRMVGVNWDVTEQRKVEEVLRLRSAALEAAASAIIISDSRGVVEWANPAFTSMSGWTLEETVGKHLGELIKSDAHDDAFYREILETIGGGRSWRGETVTRRKDKSLRTEEITITPLQNGSGALSHFIAIKHDITDRKTLEAQMLQSQRVEAIGTLANGVAHDLNNILTPLTMMAGVLKDKLADRSDRRLVELMESSAHRGADIVKQLLTFSRGLEGKRMPVQPGQIINEIAVLIRETFPREIVIEQKVSEPLWTIIVDPTQLHQVMLNLCVNARDAMVDGGRLEISASNVRLSAGEAILPAAAKPGPYVVIEIRDSGCGIAPETRHRIFDPFFTTKPIGKGTGLGLSTVLGIVRNHQGFVTVDSALNQGSTFRVYLPATGEHRESHETSPRRALSGSMQLILLVDDEQAVREATRFTLEQHGYRVLSAVNGQEALAVYHQHRKEVSLILTDMMMPVMSGMALITEIRKLDHRVPILAVSGLGGSDRRRDLAAMGVQTVLLKPYRIEELLAAMHALLLNRTAST